MSLNDTPSGERIHIGFFGRRNAGKSSLVNRMTGQSLSVVSAEKGTTTDPVYKAMELLPLGPVTIIDTPGFDDEGTLGELRVEKTRQVLGHTDIAVLVADATEPLTDGDRHLIGIFKDMEIPWILAYNKADLTKANQETEKSGVVFVSSLTGQGIDELMTRLGTLAPDKGKKQRLVADLLRPGDQVVLVVPIDEAAPKGRLILPQQQVIRDVLEAGAAAMVCRDTELGETLARLKTKPRLVITDSQVFEQVAGIVDDDVELTSFSILMARYKGFLDSAISGVAAVETLKDGDNILIAEGCTHHRQCNDIGTVKIPGWLREHSSARVTIDTCSGRDFPADLSSYKLVIHCGGCMLNQREVQRRMNLAESQEVPFINYGIFIAYVKGILSRSIEFLRV
jgi:[FeFe] hydrogenase H-cluster maturation GTPase HydF